MQRENVKSPQYKKRQIKMKTSMSART